MAVDWPTVRLAFVQGEATLPELVERFGIYPDSLVKRAEKEGWHDEREREAERRRSLGSDGDDAIRQLARFNEDDLTVARAIRAKAAQMISAATTPAEINALAKVFDIAHKIGRKALGADPD